MNKGPKGHCPNLLRRPIPKTQTQIGICDPAPWLHQHIKQRTQQEAQRPYPGQWQQCQKMHHADAKPTPAATQHQSS